MTIITVTAHDNNPVYSNLRLEKVPAARFAAALNTAYPLEQQREDLRRLLNQNMRLEEALFELQISNGLLFNFSPDYTLLVDPTTIANYDNFLIENSEGVVGALCASVKNTLAPNGTEVNTITIEHDWVTPNNKNNGLMLMAQISFCNEIYQDFPNPSIRVEIEREDVLAQEIATQLGATKGEPISTEHIEGEESGKVYEEWTAYATDFYIAMKALGEQPVNEATPDQENILTALAAMTWANSPQHIKNEILFQQQIMAALDQLGLD